MDSIYNHPGMPKKSRLDKMKKQYKTAPHLSIPEGVAKRKEILNNRRKIAKTSILDADRNLDVPDEEVIKSNEQYKQRILEWKLKKEKQKKEPANKVKPFLTGAVKVPLYYVPPPPLPKNKQKNKVVNTNGGEYKNNKQVSNIPKINESNLTKSKKYSVFSKKEKYQTVSKISQPKSQAGPSYQSKLKVISEENATISKFQTQLNSEVDRILKMCASWDKISKTAKLPGFVQELVLAVTGQGRLLVSQKMAQFRSLIEASKKRNCPGKSGAAPVLSQDLHGFWDMIHLQVEDIDKRFGKLEQLKANNWEEENSKENKKPSKKGYTKSAFKLQKKPAVTSRIREIILDARKKMMAKKHPVNEEAEGVETSDAGSFTIQWTTRTADEQLQLPSTSGTVPAQYASAPGASRSTNTPFEGQEAVKERRCELERLEENCLEQERSEENMKRKCNIKRPSASSDIKQFITQPEKASHVISPKKELENKEISNICLISSSEPSLPSSSSSITPFE